MSADGRTSGDLISTKEVLRVFWEKRLLTWGLVALLTLFAGVAGVVIPKTYKAAATLAPVTSEPGAQELRGLGSLTSAVSSLASIAGLSVGTENTSAQSLAVLQSEFLTEKYIEQNNLIDVLYPRNPSRWHINGGSEKPPTLWVADQYFKRHILSVSTNERTGLIVVTVSWRDPQIAAKWANGLVQMANDYLREKAIQETERNITYLDGQAAKTDELGIKDAIYSLLETQINKAMLSRGSEEYAFKVLDPAIAPEQPSTPPPIVWVLAGIFTGFIAALVVAFVVVAWRKS